jgi:hypothetical protein
MHYRNNVNDSGEKEKWPKRRLSRSGKTAGHKMSVEEGLSSE